MTQKLPGKFIVLEGGEAVGKSTMIHELKAVYEQLGHTVVCVREPGGTEFGQDVRRLFLKHQAFITSRAQVMLLLATKAELIFREIRPALAAGHIVLSDRYTLSLMVYQGILGGYPLPALKDLLRAAGLDLEPDETIVLTCTPETALQRLRGRADRNSMDSDVLADHQRLHAAYAQLMDSSMHVIDTTNRYPHEILDEILRALDIPAKASPESV